MRFAAICVLALAFFAGLPLLATQNRDEISQTPEQQKVDAIFSSFDKPDSPGCAIGVIRNGWFAYRHGYGMGSLEMQAPLTPASVFYMGSVSKQFTAASVVLAAEHGLLSLDDDVRKYIPELPDYGTPITLREMLHHTSGLRDFLGLLELSGRHGEDIHSKAEMLDLIVRQKGLNNKPGDEYIYSNTNYFLAGIVVERVSKKTLAEFAAESIFKPLGMADTRFYEDRSVVVVGRVAAYSAGEGGKFNVDWSTNYDTVGAGGLMSSVDDLMKWDQNFYQNKLGKGTLVKELQTRGTLNNGKIIDYALGLQMSTYRGLPMVEHDGALFGYRTAIVRFPEQKFSVICLCNLGSAGPETLAHKVADIYLANELKPEAGAEAVKNGSNGLSGSNGEKFPEAATFAGRYEDPRSHWVFNFTAVDGNLHGWDGTLRRTGANRFKDLGNDDMTFTEANGTMKLVLDMGGNVLFEGSRVKEVKPSDAEVAAFAGVYRSEELDATYNLTAEKGDLVLKIGWNPPVTFKALSADEFENDEFGVLVFRRGAGGRVAGFDLFAGRDRNIGFEKVK
jgi:CubicO group peptidase (beta-lactamase class C family)